MENIKILITECPRDAMQGIQEFIPTKDKIAYINLLAEVGFDTIDVGSFVSHKSMPQMADSETVFTNINISKSKNLAIVANERGTTDACKFNNIEYIGFPLSVSETFQKRNTNKSIAEAFESLKNIQQITNEHNKQTRVYLSMGFGNPYGDDYSIDLLTSFVQKLLALGIYNIVPSDTTGSSNENLIFEIYSQLHKKFPDLTFGCHLHAKIEETNQKIEAAFNAGVTHFDTALLGFGGCPMAADLLTGNIPTEILVEFFEKKGVDLGLDLEKFEQAKWMAKKIFH